MQTGAMDSAQQVVYTCSMDPQVRRTEPGLCPICRMPLTPLISRLQGDTLTLSGTERLQMGIATERFVPGRRELRLAATLVPDETALVQIAFRTGGRLERTASLAPGQRVQAGQFLATLYSADVAAVQAQYLAAMGDVQQAARARLVVLGVGVPKAGANADGLITLRATKAGILQDALPRPGTYLMAEQTVATLLQSGRLRVEAQWPGYLASALPTQERLQKAQAQLLLTGGRTVALATPTLGTDLEAGVLKLRAVLPTAAGSAATLQAGTAVTLLLLLPETKTTPVYSGAVVYGNAGPRVWVALAGKNGSARFVPRDIALNAGQGVQFGLEAGTEVVTEGAYLLESEYKLRRNQ